MAAERDTERSGPAMRWLANAARFGANQRWWRRRLDKPTPPLIDWLGWQPDMAIGAVLPAMQRHDQASGGTPKVIALRPPPQADGQDFASHARRLKEQRGVHALLAIDGVEANDNFAAARQRHEYLEFLGFDGLLSSGGGGGDVIAVEASAWVTFLGNMIQTRAISGRQSTNIARLVSPRLAACERIDAHATASLWHGHLVWPDFGPIDTRDAHAAMLAAFAAISGGPVWIGDKPGESDAAIVKKIAMPNGDVPRPMHPAMLTAGCIAIDCHAGEGLLKVFNHNRHGGVVGVFNVSDRPLDGSASPMDVIAFEDAVALRSTGDFFAVHAHHAGTLSAVAAGAKMAVTLQPGDAEVFSLVPIIRGFAAIGVVDCFNAGGTVENVRFERDAVIVQLRAGGRFIAWADQRPSRVMVRGRPVAFRFEKDAKTLTVDVASDAACVVEIGLT